jgi:hypothetical protein
MSQNDGNITNTEGTFLSLINREERVHTRHSTYLRCEVSYMKTGIRGYSTLQAVLLNISQGGALIELPMTLGTGHHVYLILQNYPAKITSAIVDITTHGTHLKFANLLLLDDVMQIAAGRPYEKSDNKHTMR